MSGARSTTAGLPGSSAKAGCEDRATAANVEVPPPGMEFGPLGPGRFIAQVRDGQLIGVSHVIVLEGRPDG